MNENSKEIIDVEPQPRPAHPPGQKGHREWIGPAISGVGLLIAGWFLVRQMQDGFSARPADPKPSSSPAMATPTPTPLPTVSPSPVTAQQPVTTGFSVPLDYPGQITDGLSGTVVRVNCPGCAANFRKGPSVTSPVVAVIYSGELVQLGSKRVEQEGTLWAEVVYRGQTGWVAANLLEGVSNGQ